MRAIEIKSIELRPPGPEQVQDIYEKTRALYSRAYDWDAPDIAGKREYLGSTGWRQYVRTWIATWDLRRLYDYTPQTVAEAVSLSYDEDVDLQSEPALDAPDDPFANE